MAGAAASLCCFQKPGDAVADPLQSSKARAQVANLRLDEPGPGLQGAIKVFHALRQLCHGILGVLPGTRCRIFASCDGLFGRRLRVALEILLRHLVNLTLRVVIQLQWATVVLMLHILGPHQTCELLEVCHTSWADPRNVIRLVVQKHQQAGVHLVLEVGQGQVVVVVAEWVLKLACDEVEREHSEDWHEREDSCPRLVLNELRYHDRRKDHVKHQQHGDELCIGEGKARVGDLLCIEEVHKASRERLVGSGEDWRRDLEDLVVEGMCDQGLDQVEDHLHPVEEMHFLALPQVLEREQVEAKHVYRRYAPRVRGGNLLQCAAVAQTHQPHYGVPEVRNFLWLVWQGTPGKRHAAANRVEPLTPHLMQQPGALPEPGERLPGAKAEQDGEHPCCGSPRLTPGD
mmetsp:Transcript_56517/g.127506  ORF Transcript_56517/g.127506 Transcript_56517/m.127506 type:complete len:402 (+) Transcript_56517:178-1383(+)